MNHFKLACENVEVLVAVTMVLEDGGDTFLRIMDKVLPDNTESHRRK
jgi:hypothetical protein